jgi:TonB family protein
MVNTALEAARFAERNIRMPSRILISGIQRSGYQLRCGLVDDQLPPGEVLAERPSGACVSAASQHQTLEGAMKRVPISEPVAPVEAAGTTGARAPAFTHLIASKPGRDLASTARTSLASLLIHGAVLAGLVIATMSVGEEVLGPEQVTAIELPPEAAPPPPPVVRFSAPQIAAPRGFQTLAVPDFVPPDIPPPSPGFLVRPEDYTGTGREGGVAREEEETTRELLENAPRITPFTLAPELTNRVEITRLLVRDYPPLLRDAGIGGTVLVWVFIDDRGAVLKTQVKEGSGYEALDQAALGVAAGMRFRPAQNRDKAVPVWVEIPVVFTAAGR